MLPRLWLAVVLFVLLLAGSCAPAQPAEPTQEPSQVVTQAVKNIRGASSFRLNVERTGADYFFQTDVGNVLFRRATAQYVAPNTLQGKLRVIIAGLPADVSIFARGTDQWFSNDVLTGGHWSHKPLTPGFNPEFLIDSDGGFQAAVSALHDLAYLGEEMLDSGASAQHFKAKANGPEIGGLLANLVQFAGAVTVDVFVDPKVFLPIRFVVVEPDSVTTKQPAPLTFTIDIYDVNAAPQLDDPQKKS